MQIIQTKSFKLASISQGDPNSDKIAILIPGRLDTKNYINFIKHMDFLASKGFYALSFDYPGTWDSPGEDVKYTMTNYIKAVHELIEFLGNKPTLLFGHSRGGQTAMFVGCQNENVVGFAVVNATFGPPTPPDPEKIVDGFLIEQRDLPPGDTRTTKRKEFRLPLSYWEDGKKYDCVPVLETCIKPKLIIHGTEDEYQSLEKVKGIYAKIQDPKMLKVIESDHDYRLHVGVIEEVNRYLGEFINKYL